MSVRWHGSMNFVVACVLALAALSGVVRAQSQDSPRGFPMESAIGNARPPDALPVTPPALLNQATVTLAAGDVVTMSVFGRPELTTTVYVSDGGAIDVPLGVRREMLDDLGIEGIVFLGALTLLLLATDIVNPISIS